MVLEFPSRACGSFLKVRGFSPSTKGLGVWPTRVDNIEVQGQVQNIGKWGSAYQLAVRHAERLSVLSINSSTDRTSD